MGSPLSGLLADIYINDFENKYIFTKNNTFYNNIIFYAKYVDDTFLIFDGTIRQIDNFLNYLNKKSKNIQFTVEHENNKRINFLDLTIIKNFNHLEFKIYRKLTTTDTTIHAKSFHPYHQKMAAYNSFIHRLINTPLNHSDYLYEINIIKNIAINNGYNPNIIDKLIQKFQIFQKY